MAHLHFSQLPFPRLLRLLVVGEFLLGVLWLDVSMPLGVAVPVLYAIPVSWIALWSGRRETFALIATGLSATILIMLRYVLASAEDADLAVVNRLLASCVIWATVLLALFRKVQEEDRKLRATLSDVLKKLTRRKWKR